MTDRDTRAAVEEATGIPPEEQGWRAGPTPAVIPEGLELEQRRTDGAWRIRPAVTGEPELGEPDAQQAAIAGRFAGMFPPHTPGRIAGARRKAQLLGLPFTPDMTISDAQDGVRAVDALGRVGAFREQAPRAISTRGIAPSTSGVGAAGDAVILDHPGKRLVAFISDEDAAKEGVLDEAQADWPLVVRLSALERAWVLLETANDWSDEAVDVDPEVARSVAEKSANWRAAASAWREEVYEPALKEAEESERAASEPDLYRAPEWPRNGREAGAWAAGVVLERTHVLVRLKSRHVDGAVTSLIEAGMQVAKRGMDSGFPVLDIQAPDEDQGLNLRTAPAAVIAAGPVPQPVLAQGENA